MVNSVLKNQFPQDFVYAPNYWQWFEHHKNHNILPDEIKHCNTLLELIQYLGLDVFSRNIYCDQQEYWFGGICEEYFDDNVIKTVEKDRTSSDIHTNIHFSLRNGVLHEKLLYVFNESTVVQKEFLIKDYKEQIPLLKDFVQARKWRFNKSILDEHQNRVGKNGVVVVGDYHSPLKMLHILLGPVNSVYFLLQDMSEANQILGLHEKAQLDAIEATVAGGARVVMSMDNLDTMFHPPEFVEQYSASFYKKASDICHAYGAKFMIHACGNQKDNLNLISSLGVDGLEGVAYPPLGNVSLKEAMEMTHDHFIITGGISASEIETLKTKEEIFSYTRNLFETMKPFKNRFIFSASCNTPINTPWSTIINFRDAWLEYKKL